MDEIYEPLLDFELYEINRNGVIRNIETQNVIKPCMYGGLYPWVMLYKREYDANDVLIKRNKYKRYIHRLVALQYHPNPQNKPYIDHINRIREDYRADNLRWATRQENAANVISDNITIKRYRRRNGGNPIYFWSTRKGDEIHKSANGYNTREEAREAYMRYHKQLYGEFSPY